MVAPLLNSCHAPFPVDGQDLEASNNGELLGYDLQSVISLLNLEDKIKQGF